MNSWNEQSESQVNLPPEILAGLSDIEFMKKELQVRKARDNFWEYRLLINKKLKVGWWQLEIAEKLQQFADDLIAGKRPILIIQAPPQHGKSVQIIDFITWIAGKYPHLRKIFASFSDRLGVRANLRMQRIMMSDDFKRVFPDFKLPTKSDKGYKLNANLIEYVHDDGSFRNTTAGGSITGESLDLGIIDDPIKGREAANSETIREKSWEWFTDDFFTRFSEEAGLLIIGTRWHIDDPIGRLIKQKLDNTILLKYPAIAIENEKHRKEGEALFPELKSKEFILIRKKSLGTANYEALYQQSPILIGGGIFKDEWWRYYDLLPKIKYSLIIADTAMKTKEQNDYSVFMLIGKGQDGNAYIIDVLRGKWEAPMLKTQFVAFYNKHKNNKDLRLRNAAIEDKASGTGLIQSIKKDDKIPVRAIKRDSQDKVSRAMSVAPRVESGYVYLNKNATWLSDYLSEHSAFPNGAHDDQVDVTSDGLDQIFNTVQEFNARVI